MKHLRYFLLISAVALVACKNGGGKADEPISTDIVANPMSASETGDKELPVFSVSESSHDFGKVKQGEKVVYDFRFKNTGESDLIITSASGSCGCTVPDYPKDPIKPGKEGMIHVEFNSEGRSGKQNKTVTVLANTIPNSHVLTLTGEVIPPPAEEKK